MDPEEHGVGHVLEVGVLVQALIAPDAAEQLDPQEGEQEVQGEQQAPDVGQGGDREHRGPDEGADPLLDLQDTQDAPQAGHAEQRVDPEVPTVDKAHDHFRGLKHDDDEPQRPQDADHPPPRRRCHELLVLARDVLDHGLVRGQDIGAGSLLRAEGGQEALLQRPFSQTAQPTFNASFRIPSLATAQAEPQR